MRSIERLFARMFVRLRCGVSCATCGHVPLYAITATATATVCDHGRTCRAHVVSVRHVVTVAVMAITSWRPGCGCGIACLRWRPGRDVVV